MRNPSSSSRTSSVRPLAAAVLLGAALITAEAAMPAAQAVPRSAAVSLGDFAGGAADGPRPSSPHASPLKSDACNVRAGCRTGASAGHPTC